MNLKLLPNNAMTFTENQHGNAVLDKLKQQREANRCCDVILHVNEKQYHAHRCVLCACSPFFDSLFKVHKAVREQINITADSSEVVHIVLAYMYTGTVIVDKRNVSELLKLADTFLLSKLKDYCAEYLQRYLDTRNCLTILEMSNKFCLESLQKIANSHISMHLQEVLDGEEVLEISMLRLENFIKNSNWRISYEKILALITSWVYHNPEERESNFRSLLTWILWRDIDPERVVYIVQEHPLFSYSRICRSFIIDVLNEHSLLCQPTYDKLAVLKTKGSESESMDDDNDNFINIAITTAISEANVDKYFMDTGKDLLKADLQSNEHHHLELRDPNQAKSLISDFSTSYSSSNAKSTFSNIPTFQSLSNYPQNFDIEELCKYSVENTQKPKQYIIDNSDGEHCHAASKTCDYESNSYDHQSNCYHYKDFRDSEHSVGQNNDKCPKLTNKISYMNHKFDVNHANQLYIPFNDLNYQKNSSASELTPSKFQLELSKDSAINLGGGNYTDDHLNISFSQENPYQSVSPMSPGGYKKDHQTISDDNVCEEQNEIQDSFLDHNVNLNSIAYLKANSFVMSSSSQPEFLYMDCSNDTQSSNNYPQDMSLTHLKLSECNATVALEHSKDNAYTELENDLQRMNTHVKEESHTECIAVDNTQPNLNSPSQQELVKKEESSNQAVCGYQENRYSEAESEYISPPMDADSTDENVVHSHEETNSSSTCKLQTTADIPCTEEKLSKKNSGNKKKSEKKCIKKTARKDAVTTPKIVKTCEVCDTTFDRKKDYFVHMTEHFPGPPHQCDSCNSTFKRIYYLLDHRHTHSDQKQFKCNQCAFTSHRMFNLKEHKMLHSSEKPFKCDECGSMFTRKQHLVIHRTKHTNDRPLICETCGWSAKTRNSLLLHTKIHTGDLYSCQYPDCAYRTPKKSHLKEHMHYHTKSRPFACKICDTRFISKSHLQRHLPKHETPNLFQCSQCDYCISRLDSLKIHIKRKHSATKPKLKPRKGQLKKKDALLSNNFNIKKTEFMPNVVSNEQNLFSNLNNSGGRISPNSSLPPLSETFSHYPSTSSSPSSCTFGTPGDPDDPLAIVSEMEDENQSTYLDSNIGQAFSGLLDAPCESDRFTLPSNDDLYYN